MVHFGDYILPLFILLTRSSLFATGGRFLPPVAIFLPPSDIICHQLILVANGLVANSDFSVANFLPPRPHWPSLFHGVKENHFKALMTEDSNKALIKDTILPLQQVV